MTNDEKELWARVYAAYIEHHGAYHMAYNPETRVSNAERASFAADEALEEFKKR